MSATVSYALADLAGPVADRLRDWEREDFGRRLWEGDHALWSAEPVPELTDRLGWLRLPRTAAQAWPEWRDFAERARAQFDQVALLGMGGSSLAPEVFQKTFGPAPGYPDLLVADSTHPAAVQAARSRLNLERTLFLASSKSGGTLETLSLLRYFWEQTARLTEDPGRRFAAVTDSGSGLESLARKRGFRRVFHAPPDVGGRYSALTAFGLVPAALLGMDVPRLLAGAEAMMGECGPDRAPADNPGLKLGAALGEAARAGRDKITFLCSPALASFGAWAEQLLAESTGKRGTGLVPVADEPLGDYRAYGPDRFFIHLALAGDDPAGVPALLETLQAARHPIVRITMDDPCDLGGEMYRSEMAVAAAGAALGINPFDQPDVQVAKDLANRAMSGGEEAAPVPEADATDPSQAPALAAAWENWISGLRSGDYLAVQVYLPMDGPAAPLIDELRRVLRDSRRAAATVGYGPRFLHSTGQLHKGGADNGLFLQIVDRPRPELPVPETDFTFGELITAQAAGDCRALLQRGRRTLRVNAGDDPVAAVRALLDLARDGNYGN